MVYNGSTLGSRTGWKTPEEISPSFLAKASKDWRFAEKKIEGSENRKSTQVEDWVEHHGGRPRFSAVKKVWRFFPTFGRHKGLHLVRTLAYAAEEPKEEREEENRKIFLDQSAFD